MLSFTQRLFDLSGCLKETDNGVETAGGKLFVQAACSNQKPVEGDPPPRKKIMHFQYDVFSVAMPWP